MFSKYFSPEKIQSLLKLPLPSESKVNELLQKTSYGLEDLALLILASSNEFARLQIVEEAVRRRAAKWQKQLFLMPPLYVSNNCLDRCLYCNYRKGNVPKERLMLLTAEETGSEAAYLLNTGYGDIELVAATDQWLLTAKNATQLIEAAQNVGAENIGINFLPYATTSEYKQLAQVGCTFNIVWQETYDPATYQRIHAGGPKANMKRRLDAHDCAVQGGINVIGVAFLGGLYDWKYDVLATIVHALYLQQSYGAKIIFGMPRWKPGMGIPMKAAPYFYGDEIYRLVGALYSLALPDSLDWFSTREPFELSAACAQGGGCVFTLDCSTEVGGYTREHGFAQFPVYSYSFKEGVERLKSLGFQPQIHLPW